MLLEYISDLFELSSYSQANPDNEDLANWIYTYDVGFPLADLITLGYVDVATLPEKSVEEIVITWNATNDEGLFG